MMNMTTEQPDRFPHTRDEYQHWLTRKPRLDKMIDEAKTNAEVELWEKHSREAWQLVQDAFFEDTKHINSRDHCRLITEKDVMNWLGIPH